MLVDSSRLVADMVVSEVGHDQAKMQALFELALQRNDQTGMRAARAFDLVDEAREGMAAPYLKRIRAAIRELEHTSVIRSFLRTLMRYPVPEDEDELGAFYELTLSLMKNTRLPVALRYYGMSLACEVAFVWPDLRFELFPVFDDIAQESSSGLTGRARYFKKMLMDKFGVE